VARPVHTPRMSDWYVTREHQPGVWLVSEPPHVNCFLVTGRERAVLVDTGLGFVPVRDVIDELTELPVLVVNTHYHWDHVGGNAAFPEISIHEAGAAELRRGPDMDAIRPYAEWAGHVLERFGEFRALDEELFWFVTEETTPRPLPEGFDLGAWHIAPSVPTRLLRDGDTLDLGGRELRVIHTPGHTPDSICLFDERNGLVFGGDTYNTGPIYAHLPDSDLEAFARSMARVEPLAEGVRFVYVAHFARYVETGGFLREVAEGFRVALDGAVRWEDTRDESGRPARLARFARFGILAPPEPA
jgi:glyoxylase-like metal-dependent hydrolase (beta-lactamase superfamily II)